MAESRIIGGFHAVRTALAHGADGVQEVWIDSKRRDKRMREIEQRCASEKIAIHRVPREELDQRAPNTNHQGVAARTQAPASLSERDLENILGQVDQPLLLVLDGVQDPHNLGAILRTADAAGVAAVIAPKDKSVGLTPSVCKIASGAAETVPYIQVTNLVRSLQFIQNHYNVWVTGTASEAETSVYDVDFKGATAIVLGGEQNGLRRLVRETCDQLVKIPMSGKVESLNVSVAAGICLFESLRQRNI